MELYKSAKLFVKDVCDPYVVGFKLISDEKLKTMKAAVQALYDLCIQTLLYFQTVIVSFVSAKQLEIHQTEVTFTDAYDQAQSDLSSHITNYSNPHVVTAAQVSTVSSLPPATAQGSVGDVWIEYNNS